jgi:hypothetical protein
MKKATWLWIFVACAMGLALTPLFAQTPDLSGTWVGTTQIPDGTVDEVTLVLKKADTGYTGTVSDSLGLIAGNTDINDVKLEGSDLSFTLYLADGNLITIKLTVTADKLTGQWEHPEGSTGTLELLKKA